jgi:hypothetical protein
MAPPNHGRLRWLSRLQFAFLAVWVGALAHAANLGITSPGRPDPQHARTYPYEYKGRVVYITSSDWWWMYGLMAVGWGGIVTCILVYRRLDRRRLPQAPTD